MEPDQIVITAQKAARKFRAPYHMYEEMIGEATLAAFEATKTWDSTKGPEGPWVYQCARWAVLSYLNREYKHYDAAEITEMNEPLVFFDYLDDWRDLVERLQKLDSLTTQVIIAYAFGTPMAAMSKRFKATGGNLKAIVEQGRAQLSAGMIS